MNFRFYRAQPGAAVAWPQAAPGAEAAFVLIALENTLDPDANNHTGFDFFGAYGGDGSLIDAWAANQAIEAISKSGLPNPVTFYPAPFHEA